MSNLADAGRFDLSAEISGVEARNNTAGATKPGLDETGV